MLDLHLIVTKCPLDRKMNVILRIAIRRHIFFFAVMAGNKIFQFLRWKPTNESNRMERKNKMWLQFDLWGMPLLRFFEW